MKLNIDLINKCNNNQPWNLNMYIIHDFLTMM